MIEPIKKHSNCHVDLYIPFSPFRFPTNHVMPDDLRKFYNIAGGAVMNTNHQPEPVIILPAHLLKTTTEEMLFGGVTSKVNESGEIVYVDDEGDIYDNLSNN